MTTVSATLSAVSGGGATGARLSGEFNKVGRVESKISQRSKLCSRWLCLNEHQWLHCSGVSGSGRSNNASDPIFALRKDSDDGFLSNMEDTDEMFDELFNKYGKVIYRRDDKKPPTAEIDDDAESLAFAVAMAKVASDVKAADIRVLFVKPLVYWTRFFIIATAFSRPQIDAISSRIRDLAEKNYGKVPTGDTKPNSWTLLDYGDVVVHIFLPQQREFYNLEEFYGNATLIELPFENQPPFRN